METEAVFIAQPKGTWTHDNIVIEHDGSSAYTVYITWKGTQGGWEEANTTVCKVPHQMAMISLLSDLTGKRPLFTTLAGESILYH